jgi:hypothetical protein
MVRQTQHFLIIDDDAAERALVAYTLKDAYPDSDIHQVQTPDEAEKICGERSFDCVILDYNMPQMDGLTLTQTVSAPSLGAGHKRRRRNAGGARADRRRFGLHPEGADQCGFDSPHHRARHTRVDASTRHRRAAQRT